MSYRADIQALQTCVAVLADGNGTVQAREAATKLHAQVLARLLLRTTRQQTGQLARRVQELEEQLADFDPSERKAAICSRLQLSKSRYYRLRSVPLRSGTVS
jgi:hypothetical protein